MRLIAAGLLALSLSVCLPAETLCGLNAPCYPAGGIVNAASGAHDSLATHTWASLYGTNLSYITASRNVVSGPPNFGGVSVVVNGTSAFISYVSPGQVNFLIPRKLAEGPARIRLLRDSASGPTVTVEFSDCAPALFQQNASTAIGAHPDWTVVTPESPAHPGEYVILYATGLGPFVRSPEEYTAASWASEIGRRSEFSLLLDGEKVPDHLVEYVGTAPLLIGLYQINLKLPDDVRPYPEIRIGLGDRLSPVGIRLPVEERNGQASEYLPSGRLTLHATP